MSLSAAARIGDLDVVRELLAHGADPSLRQPDGSRALDEAAGGGHRQIVLTLVAHDPSVINLPGARGQTALMRAAAAGHPAVVEMLLALGADPTLQAEDGARALDWAAYRGHDGVVARLLAHNPGLLELPGADERTPLQAAAGSGHAAVVRLLLARGADPRHRLPTGRRALDWAAAAGHVAVVAELLAHDPTLVDLPGSREHSALMMAAGRGHPAVVSLLLAHGADPRQVADGGARALDWAAQEGHLEVIERLLTHDPSLLDLQGYHQRTALTAAAGNGHLAVVQSLLTRGADPRARLDDGRRALDWAASQGDQAVVECLLAHDPGLIDLPGAGEYTALMAACGGGYLALVTLMLEKGADPRRPMDDGALPLDCAVQENLRGVIDLLLAHDPGLVDLPGYHGRTPLAVAAGTGQLELVDLFLSRGADPRVRMSNGTRALDWAAQEGHQAIVERLLAHDPELLRLPKEGDFTALIMAVGAGHAALVGTLLARGADPRQGLEDGTLPLELAAQEGHAAIVEILLDHDPTLRDLPGRHGRSALAAAAGYGHLKVLEVLLARGADPHLRMEGGARALDWAASNKHQPILERLLAHDPSLLDLPGVNEHTALMEAAVHGHTSAVLLLLSFGADPRIRGVDGERALDMAAHKGHVDVVASLLAHDSSLVDLPGFHDCTAIYAAACYGQAAVVEVLLNHGANVRSCLGDGTRVLDWAAHREHLNVMERLLAHDPSLVELTGFGGRTPLLTAAGDGKLAVVDFLLMHGADARTRHEDGARALDWAARNGHKEVVERLLAHDPDLLDLPGERERTALGAAAVGGHTPIVALLLARGADATAVNVDGICPMEWAAHEGHLDTLECMLAHDPSLLHEPSGECSALLAASSAGQAQVVRALLARGANAHRRGPDGRSALDHAAGMGRLAVVEALLQFDRTLVRPREEAVTS